MTHQTCRTALLGAIALFAPAMAEAARVPLAVADPANGITDLFSATFDGALAPCTPTDPAFCAFFNGKPGANRAIVISPNPTGVTTAVPQGLGPTAPGGPAAAAGSFLDITVNGASTQATLAGGVIALPQIGLTIQATTVVTATGAGIVIDAAPQVAAINAQRQAEFLVSLAPATAADFSFFSTVAFPPAGSCTGPLCGLIPILTLDMVRYRLLVQFDPTFTTFTASYIGQTANNSFLSLTLNSETRTATITDTAGAPDDRSIDFGSVFVGGTAAQAVTVTNTGTGPLAIGQVAGSDPLAAPFALAADGCSNQTLGPGAACVVSVQFAPGATGTPADSFDIPSDDPATPVATVSLAGTAVPVPVPEITVTPLAPAFGSVTVGQPAPITVTVANNGTAPLVLGALDPAGLGTAFSLANDACSNQTLPPAPAAGSQCSVDVVFQPGAVGPATGSFAVPSNDPDEATVTVSATGTGTAVPVADITITDPVAPAGDRALDFGSVGAGARRELVLGIGNAGTASLVLGTLGATNALAAPFAIKAGADQCSGQTVAPGASCSVTLEFAPTGGGTVSDSFSVPSSDPDEPMVTVNVTGTGIPVGTTKRPDGASSGFFGAATDPWTAAGLGLVAFGAARRRRRRSAPPG